MKRFVLAILMLILLIKAQQNQTTAPSTNSQQPQPEYTADDIKFKMNELDSVIAKQIEDAKRIMLNRNHSQHYSFLLDELVDQQFIFAVDVDEEMEAIIVVYWEEGDTFAVSRKAEGEEIRVLVYEDSKNLVGSWGFYHAGGISFHAKKEHQYLMKLITKGKRKMLVMDVQNFVYKGSSHHIANKNDVQPHQQRMKGLHQKLQSFMAVAESNHYINQLISQNVRLHMKRYMVYQIIQGLLIFSFTVAQGYFIRRLLNRGYSIV